MSAAFPSTAGGSSGGPIRVWPPAAAPQPEQHPTDGGVRDNVRGVPGDKCPLVSARKGEVGGVCRRQERGREAWRDAGHAATHLRGAREVKRGSAWVARRKTEGQRKKEEIQIVFLHNR
jgi:hypothetical protein